jgi:protein-disulfide isomerase
VTTQITKRKWIFHSFALVFLVMSIGNASAVSAQSDDKVVAKIGARSITQKDVDDSIGSQLFPLEQQMYALRKAALENLVTRTLLEQAAMKRGISVDELKKEFTSSKVEVLANQVEHLYSENSPAFGAMSPDEAKERIRLDLESEMRMKLYRNALAELRKSAHVETYLEGPKLFVKGDIVTAPSMGPGDAPITIVEFSDFQCPFCRQSQTTIKQILQDYPNRVRLVFRYLPLEIHEHAFTSAQAAFCSSQQGLFWKYHDALFTSEDLSVATLHQIATKIGLNTTRFEECMTSTASRDAVLNDVQDAKRFGINSTPTFIVNGTFVRGAVGLREFKDLIDRELRSTGGGDRSQ